MTTIKLLSIKNDSNIDENIKIIWETIVLLKFFRILIKKINRNTIIIDKNNTYLKS